MNYLNLTVPVTFALFVVLSYTWTVVALTASICRATRLAIVATIFMVWALIGCWAYGPTTTVEATPTAVEVPWQPITDDIQPTPAPGVHPDFPAPVTKPQLGAGHRPGCGAGY